MPNGFDEEQESPTGAEGLSERLSALFSERGTLVVAIGATVGGAALLCLFVFLLLRSQVAEETPTATPQVSEVAAVASESVLIEAFSESGAISLTLEAPIFLNVGGLEFSVLPVTLPESGAWVAETPNETTALWAYGSVINYVFGLEDVEENRALLNSVVAGDEIVLTNRNGSELLFSVNAREFLNPNNRDIFAQRAPLVTVVLLDEDGEADRLVVQGSYVVPDASQEAAAGRVVGIGETAQIQDLQVTVSGASTLVGRAEIPAGFSFFLIDYQVNNVGQTAFDVERLNKVLSDQLGNLYAANPTASQLGNYRPLAGLVTPGQTVVATAGYQLPVGLQSETVRWQLIDRDTGSQIEVVVPFRESGAEGSQAVVQLQSGQVSADGTNLLLTGQITNLGEQAAVIDVGNVTLTSDGTNYLMLSTNPAFPWVVAPGQTLAYQVTFQRPAGSTAVFQIFDQAFQLTDLR